MRAFVVCLSFACLMVGCGRETVREERAGSAVQKVRIHHATDLEADVSFQTGSVLVLHEHPNEQVYDYYQALADRHNAGADHEGFRPYFGVRRSRDRGLQLVYGSLGDGSYGIEPDPIARRRLSEWFPKAYWLRID